MIVEFVKLVKNVAQNMETVTPWKCLTNFGQNDVEQIVNCLRKCWVWSGAKVRKSCRSQNMFQNEYLVLVFTCKIRLRSSRGRAIQNLLHGPYSLQLLLNYNVSIPHLHPGNPLNYGSYVRVLNFALHNICCSESVFSISSIQRGVCYVLLIVSWFFVLTQFNDASISRFRFSSMHHLSGNDLLGRSWSWPARRFLRNVFHQFEPIVSAAR